MASMHPAHVTLTALLLLSALGLVGGLRYEAPGVLAMSVVSGWFLSFVAIIIGLVVLGVTGMEAFRGKGYPTLRKSWLGVLNGVAAAFGPWILSVAI